MATGDSQETYESWLNQATDPNNEEDRWDCIQGFYQLVNQETDGPQIAIRLLAHKIQSPQEKEALQALTVLEACMNNCGKRFHKEAAKFRFLNELIKLLTPKYFGSWTPQKVKDRVTEVLYGWTLWLKDEPKIQEAYSMLKKQDIVKKDPKLPDTVIMAPPPQRTTDSVFDQEEKAKLLARLLKSQRLEDLETANRLIKNTIKEEQEKAEKVAKRDSTLKEVESSSKQLREMLEQQTVTGTLLQPSDDLKALYERCDRLRPSLFRLASDTVDDDAALAQILAANDELTLAVNVYKERLGRGVCNGRSERSKSEEATDKSNGLFTKCLILYTFAVEKYLDHVFGSSLFCLYLILFFLLLAPTSPREIKSYHLIDLSALDSPQTHRKADSPPTFEACSPPSSSHLESTFHSAADQDFTELELHNQVSKRSHAQETPKSYYEELMQTMSVKLQPASGTHLPPYNPLLPPPAISQVLLLANPQKRNVRLRYKLALIHGDQELNETGEVDNFPDWTSLISH
eukprot:superscaffoldBa00004604_g19165